MTISIEASSAPWQHLGNLRWGFRHQLSWLRNLREFASDYWNWYDSRSFVLTPEKLEKAILEQGENWRLFLTIQLIHPVLRGHAVSDGTRGCLKKYVLDLWWSLFRADYTGEAYMFMTSFIPEQNSLSLMAYLSLAMTGLCLALSLRLLHGWPNSSRAVYLATAAEPWTSMLRSKLWRKVNRCEEICSVAIILLKRCPRLGFEIIARWSFIFC